MTKNIIWFFVGVFVVVGIMLVYSPEQKIVKPTEIVSAKTVTVYKSPTCGCCGNYASYLKRAGYDVEIVETHDMNSIKDKYNIPLELQSCHTSVFGDKVVEGHIPLEAVEAFVNDDSGLASIAMPGMPSGSPGMPGRKTEEFHIFGMDAEGNKTEFMKL